MWCDSLTHHFPCIKSRYPWLRRLGVFLPQLLCHCIRCNINFKKSKGHNFKQNLIVKPDPTFAVAFSISWAVQSVSQCVPECMQQHTSSRIIKPDSWARSRRKQLSHKKTCACFGSTATVKQTKVFNTANKTEGGASRRKWTSQCMWDEKEARGPKRRGLKPVQTSSRPKTRWRRKEEENGCFHKQQAKQHVAKAWRHSAEKVTLNRNIIF